MQEREILAMNLLLEVAHKLLLLTSTLIAFNNKKELIKNWVYTAKVIRSDIFRLSPTRKNIISIFADPPYDLDRIKDITKLIFSKGIFRERGNISD